MSVAPLKNRTMSSIPPAYERRREHLRVGICPARLAFSCRDEAAVCFAVEGASFEETSSIPSADGGLLIETVIAGVVREVGPDLLVVARDGQEARVRYLLPSALDLEPLLGARVKISVSLQFSAEKRPTVDASIRDARGRLLLWAHDGALPADRADRPVVRLAHEARGPRLAFAHRGGLSTVATAEIIDLDTRGGPATAAGIRISDDDVGFIVVWH
jgi:hypothetical protein